VEDDVAVLQRRRMWPARPASKVSSAAERAFIMRGILRDGACAAPHAGAIIRAMQTVASILWRRLDAPGHDACRLERNASAWQLDGAAVFRHEGGRIAQLHYRVRCDLHWHTQWGMVRGWLGDSAVELSIARDAHGHWKLNDEAVPDLSHCVDLDLGFTPATNLLQLRRLNLSQGEAPMRRPPGSILMAAACSAS
jgi:hypothetical protein